MSITLFNKMNGRPCSCGREHKFAARIVTGSGVLDRLAAEARALGVTKAYVLTDKNTYAAAGSRVCRLLEEGGIPYAHYSFPQDRVEPDEASVGAAVMHLEPGCDLIIGVGSGVIHDIGKILSAMTRRPYIIVATAPSMDGYASATSSMNRDGLKVSLPSRCPDTIIGDSKILCQAPMRMLQSGLGDMIAKYISICEWRIANLLLGEYYCPEVARLIRGAVGQCVSQSNALAKREEKAVMAVFEGLLIGGAAMNYAGCSRPASGMEHYISHVLDMRGVEFATETDFHGLQCAAGTYLTAQLYARLVEQVPDREKALAWAKHFDFDAWSEKLRAFLGKGAESMIALEARDKKYDPALHAQRLERILEKWPEILEIIREEIPPMWFLEGALEDVDMAPTLAQLNQPGVLPRVLRCTRDIRDKYVLSRLVWDLGLEEALFGADTL